MNERADRTFEWNSGLPTAPDVEALLKAYPVETLQPGWSALDAEIRDHIGRCDGNRFHTVTDAWRRRLLANHGINVYRKKTEGFYVPTTKEVLAQAHPRIAHIGRTAKKHTREIAVIRSDDGGERIEIEHQGRLMHALSREAKKARMTLVLPPTSAADTPKITAPSNDQVTSTQIKGAS